MAGAVMAFPGIPGIPTPSDFISWFRDSWATSGQDAIKSAIQMLQSYHGTDLSHPWFESLWNRYFGLFAVLALMMVLLRSALVGIGSNPLDKLVESLLDLVRLWATGSYLFVLLSLVKLATIPLGNLIVSATTTGETDKSAPWYQNLISHAIPANLWGGFAIRFIGMVGGGALWLQAYLIQHYQLVFAILFMLSYALSGTKLGEFVRKVGKAGLITSVVAFLFQLGWLGITSQLIGKTPAMTPGQVLTSIGISVNIAWIIPLATFVVLMARDYNVKGKVDVDGHIENTPRGTAEVIVTQNSGSLQVTTVVTPPHEPKESTLGPVVAGSLLALGAERGLTALGSAVGMPAVGEAVGKGVGGHVRNRTSKPGTRPLRR